MKDNISGFIYGLLAGAALGVLAGILLAPDKGSVTRANLKRKILDLSEELGDRFEDLAGGNLDSILGKAEPSSPGKKAGARRKPAQNAKKPGRPAQPQTK